MHWPPEFVTFVTMTKRVLVPAPHEGMPEGVATMSGRNGGTLRRGGPGRARKSLRQLQAEAQRDLAIALDQARAMMEDKALSVRDRLDAMEFVRRCSGLGREKSPPRERSMIGVLRASEDEARAVIAAPNSSRTIPTR